MESPTRRLVPEIFRNGDLCRSNTMLESIDGAETMIARFSKLLVVAARAFSAVARPYRRLGVTGAWLLR